MTIKIDKLTRDHLIQSPRISVSYSSVYYFHHPGNCKVCTLDNIQWLCNNTYIHHLKRILNLSKKLVFNVQITELDKLEFLKKHFKVGYITEIPIGYYGKFQYHCCFLTENTTYSDYNGYLRRINEKERADLTKIPVKKEIILVNNIDSILTSLKEIPEKDLLKIKSYKQTKRAKDLLKSILDKK